MDDKMPTLQAAAWESGNNKPMVFEAFHPDRAEQNIKNAPTVKARDYKDAMAVVYDGSQVTCPTNSVNPKPGDPCHTLHDDSRNLLVEPVLLESNQNHATIQTDGKSTSLPASMGEGGGYVPMICLEGNGSRESHKGDGYCESETMYTLNTVEQHAVCVNGEKAGTLDASYYKGCGERNGVERDIVYTVLENHAADSRFKIADDGIFQTLGANMGMGGNNEPMVMETYQKSWDGGDISPTLTANNAGGGQRMPDKENFNCVVQSYRLDRAAYNQGKNAKYNFAVDEEKIGAQVAKGPGAVCAVDVRNSSENEINGALQSSAAHNSNSNNILRQESVVRRLTPMECERLQGYPDYWTDIGEWVDSKGKKHKNADSPRYKALGNSICLPFWQWLADRISAQYDRPVELASLFDGIGGFPLVFERAGGKAVWASEIEEFPIAVTKRRFPE